MDSYEKKYKELFEKAKAEYKRADTNHDLLEYLIPELKESEDEKIRKAIVDVFKTHCDYEVYFGVSVTDIIAWLEKQGKNNMGISEATKQELEDNLHKALEKETPESCNEFLKKQDEQILANSVKTCKDEQKPAEWEPQTGDTFRKKGTISPTYHLCNKREDGITFGFVENREVGICGGEISVFALRNNYELVERPKSIEDVVEEELNKDLQTKVEQKPAWSEEDEKMIDAIYSCVDSHYDGLAKTSLLIWLKSLRPQNRWKPSDEQITCLHDAVARYNQEGFSAATLTSLLEQLKKLREK